MTKNLVRRSVIGGLAGVALLVLSVPIAKLATNNAAIFEACINPGNGMMRLVDSSTACHKNETRIEWNEEGPAGPPGPSSIGPPYVWVCLAAYRPNTIGNQRLDVYVFNAGSASANVAVNILDKTGTNLQGAPIPGIVSEAYPGDPPATTVPLAPGHTRDVFWTMPTTGGGGPGIDGVTNVSFSVRVTSDQPIVVGANFSGGGFLESKCGLVPK